ncbi:porin [Paraburkholderia caribensis]|uniref:Porin n=1 Tax=Paraburkholderia caribensis TaxID=75105 RepID=A0A9Q6S7M0_9BURK|nr:porin [Paraburkholderia caribensis]MCO4880105.1 porin [Paraburkholderia caribensis]PTB26272.1 porin [Paraburkholderia caribensis]QLB66110.1 hypothetical protein A9O66_27960 [Paraburkholderia caribensis]
MVKRLLTGAFLGGIASMAFAQNGVTLYGIIDIGIERASGGAGAQVRQTDNTLYGSRFGFIGREELGAGYQAIFKLENGFLPNQGTAGQGGALFGREAWVGLAGPQGQFQLGVNYTPIHTLLSTYALGGFGGFSWGNASNHFLYAPLARESNSIVYVSPVVAGFSLKAMYALGTNGGANAAPKTLGNTGSVKLTYEIGNFSIGATYLNQRFATQSTNVPLTTNTPTFSGDYYVFGTSYDLGFVKLGGIWQMHRGGPNVASAVSTNFSNPKNNFFEASARIPIGFGFGLVDYGRYYRLGDSDGDATSYSLRYDYPLSKRTIVYAGAAYIRNGKRAGFAPVGVGSPAPTVVVGHNVNSVLTGLVHRF